MAVYSRGYAGRITYYRIESINIDGSITVINDENYKRSKLNPSYLICEDGNFIIGDLIEKQYIRSGYGSSYKGFGAYQSSGDTYYTNVTSSDRSLHKRKAKSNNIWAWIFAIIMLIMSLNSLSQFLSR